MRADVPPLVVLTSNRTREVHDALKRRCLYHWLEHPDFDREVAILRARLPEVTERLAREVAAATAKLRGLDLLKPPGVAEAMDWAERPARPRRPRARPRPGRPHPGRGAQVPRGHRPGARPGPRGALRWLSRRRTGSGRRHGTSWRPCSASPARCGSPGVAASPDRVEAMLQAIGALDVLDSTAVYWAGRLTLCSGPDDLDRYDAAFAAYFAGEAPRMRSVPAEQQQVVALSAPLEAGRGRGGGRRALRRRRAGQRRRGAAAPRRRRADRGRARGDAPAVRPAAARLAHARVPAPPALARTGRCTPRARSAGRCGTAAR